jgi:alpha-L-rhamnosidase
VEDISRRSFLGLTAMGIGGLITTRGWSLQSNALPTGSSLTALYRKFLDPDRKFSIRPFWFWNGTLEIGEIRRQIKQMVDHGVYGAYAHQRDGLQTPYLSEEWWTVIGQSLEAAHEYGFSLCMVDDFEWPSGEARDYWQPGPQKSLVVKANPDFQMRQLRTVEKSIQGPQSIQIRLPEGAAFVGVAQVKGPKMLDGSTLKTLEMPSGAKQIEWNAPDGDWIVFTYILETTIGQPDHGTVDLMSHEAIAEYIKIYYEEFYRRYKEHFGGAMPATFADHEGTYGGRLPWTPRLFETFEKKYGYKLEPNLPALTYDAGPLTEKIRCNLLDVVSELYSNSFFQQVTDWCAQHKIQHSGHVWEESLFFGPAYQGDFFRILRSMSNPGCDTLEEWARQSVWLKENASVADFERRHVVCENQGVQGESSYLSPERMRRVSNCLGAWNIGEFIPHAFDYDLRRTNYPPDWFRSQPYLPWFSAYADQMRRISFMNRDSHEVAEIALYYPQVSIWGQSSPAFANDQFEAINRNESWSQDATDTNEQYADLKMTLTRERLAYQVTDDHYLEKSKVEDGRLLIADSKFKVLILPPMSTIRRDTARHAEAFVKAGGTLIALRRLPTTSVESGRDDSLLIDLWQRTFDTTPTSSRFQLKRHAGGGRAYFISQSVPDVVAALLELVDPDVEVKDGPDDDLFALHKIKDGAHFYWLVNDSPVSRTNLLLLHASGRPERWDAHTGLRAPLFYESVKQGTLIRIKLDPWDAAYVTFDAQGPSQHFAVESTNLDDFHILDETAIGVTVSARSLIPNQAAASIVLVKDGKKYKGQYAPQRATPKEIVGDWTVTIEAPEISFPYVHTLEDPENVGVASAWYTRSQDELPWQGYWLSPMTNSLSTWNVIGPFPNPQDLGLDHSYPPEETIDFSASYKGDIGQSLQWLQINAADYAVEPEGRPGEIGSMKITGGPDSDTAYLVDYEGPLRLSPLHGTVFAQTYVYAPSAGKAILLLATSCPRTVFVNGKNVYSRWIRPLYNVLDDAFAAQVPIQLDAGWNLVLIKLLHNPENASGGRFMCRIQHENGDAIDGLLCSTRIYKPSPEATKASYRWLRLSVPPLVATLKRPPMRYPVLTFIDGQKMNSSSETTIPKGAKEITFRIDSREVMTSPFVGTTVSGPLPLGTWMRPGLEHFSGQMTYEKNIEIGSELLAEGLILDCGEVGVVAEAWMNDQSVGSRAWAPFAFDLSEHAHVGTNRLKVRIANTEANARAVGASRRILKNIDIDGWIGPARLVPYINTEIHLTPDA